MAKPNITTRATKGSALTWSEGDANLENLRDATISIKANTDGTSVVSDLNGEITLVAGTNVTLTGDNTAKTITIDAAGGNGGDASFDLRNGSLNLDLPSGSYDELRLVSPSTEGTVYLKGYAGDFNRNGTLKFGPNSTSLEGNSAGYIGIDYGNIALYSGMSGTGAVQIGSNYYPGTSGTTGQVLATDGSGNLYWTTPSSGGATTLDELTDVDTTTTSPTTGDVLSWDSTNSIWKPTALPNTGGDANFINGPYSGFITMELPSSTNGFVWFKNPNGSSPVVLQGVDPSNASLGFLKFSSNEVTLSDNTNSNFFKITDGAVTIQGSNNTPIKIGENYYPSITGTSGQILTADGSGNLSWTTPSSGGGDANFVKNDTYGSLELDIPATGGGNSYNPIWFKSPVANGPVTLEGMDSTLTSLGNISFTSTGVSISSGGGVGTIGISSGQPQIVAGGSATTIRLGDNYFPVSYGSSGQVLTADGSGNLSWTTPTAGASVLDDLSDVSITSPSTNQVLQYDGSGWVNATISSTGGITDIVQDTTPQLGGDLDINGKSIVSVSNGNIALTPNGTGKVILDGLNWPTSDGSMDQVLKTDGSGNLSWAFPNGPTIADDTTTNATFYPTLASQSYGSLNGTSVSSTKLSFNPSSGTLSATKFSGPLNGTVGATTPNAGTFTTLTVNAGNELRLADSDSSNYVGFKSPATVSANKVWTLPSADGTSGQFLSTNGSGVLSWAAASATLPFVSLQFSGKTLVSGITHYTGVTEIFDPANICTVASNQFTLPTGTYLIMWEPSIKQYSGTSDGVNTNFEFTAISGGTSVTGLGSLPKVSTNTHCWSPTKMSMTLSVQTTFQFRFDNNNYNGDVNPTFVTFVKMS